MKKLFSIGSGQSSLIITIVILAMLGCFYFLIYIPGNEKELKAQRFRALQQIDNNIKAKIENSMSVMGITLNARTDRNLDSNRINDYVNNFSKKNFTLSPITIDTSSSSIKSSSLKTGKPRGVTADLIKRIEVDDYSKSFNMVAIKPYGDVRYRQSMKYNFEQFVQPLLRKSLFDRYLILSKGHVVYEDFPSGFRYTKIDSLFNVRNGIFASALKDVTIGGIDYKMFMQPVGFDTINEWIICGLMDEKNFINERNQLPSQIVIFLILFSISVIIAYPWIKLFLMGSKQRLKLADGSVSLIVSMLLLSFIFFQFFQFNAVFKNDETKSSKEVLSTSLENAVNNEINKAYQQISTIDALAADDTVLQQNLNKIGKKNIVYGNRYEVGSDNSKAQIDSLKTKMINARCKQTDFFNLFWADKNGAEKFNWSKDTANGPPGEYGSRDYIKMITNKSAFQLSNDSMFYLDQIYSWTAGTFRSVISKPSKVNDGYVCCMSFNMHALDTVIMPAGYTFAIIKEDGSVLYHYETKRNLNENLIEESSAKDAFTSAIKARTASTFSNTYFNKNYNTFIKPLGMLPYYIVIMSDTSFIETRDSEVFSFTLSMLLMFFMLVLIELLIVFITSARSSKLKKQRLVTDWIWPRQSYRDDYSVATLANVLIMIVLIGFFNYATLLEFFFMLLIGSTTIAAFLNAVYYRHHKDQNNERMAAYKIKPFIILIIFALVANFVSVYLLDRAWMLFLFEVILAAILLTVYFSISRLKNFLNQTARYLKWQVNHAHTYSAMAVSRLLITSAIPIVFFYQSSYNFEQELSVNYKHVKFAESFFRKFKGNKLKQFENKGDSLLTQYGVYKDDFWIKNATIESVALKPRTGLSEKKMNKNLLSGFRIMQNNFAVESQLLYENNSADSTYFFNIDTKTTDQSEANTTLIKTQLTDSAGRPQYLKITSARAEYTMPGFSGKGILFWLLLFSAIGLFYYAIYMIIRKMFGLDLPDISAYNDVDGEIVKYHKLNRLLFIIGPPGSGKKSYILSKIKKGELLDSAGQSLIYDANDKSKSNVVFFDVFNPDDYNKLMPEKNEDGSFKNKNQKEIKCVVINNFEYKIKDVDFNHKKLDLIEKLMIEGTKKIIILSAIHPVAFMQSFTENETLTADEKKKLDLDTERWGILLGHYRNIYLPISNISRQTDEKAMDTSEHDLHHGLFLNELRHTNFLNDMYDVFKNSESNKSGKFYHDNDDLIIKVQLTAQNFYNYIWNTLSYEEKFLIYDLAEDGLVNTSDAFNLGILMSKGIVVPEDGVLKLFNKSFRNFILTSISKAEANRIEKQIKDTGGWSQMQTPIIVVILVVLAFLLSSQQESYNKVVGYIGTLAAAIPVLMNIMKVFDTGSSGSKN